jgi:hypothetical protein
LSVCLVNNNKPVKTWKNSVCSETKSSPSSQRKKNAKNLWKTKEKTNPCLQQPIKQKCFL